LKGHAAEVRLVVFEENRVPAYCPSRKCYLAMEPITWLSWS